MLLFVPGRHHLLTQFQHDYLLMLATQGIEAAECIRYNDPEFVLEGSIDGVIFAITSSNHYLAEGYCVATAERGSNVTYEYVRTLPWELVEQIAMSSQDLDSPQIQRTVHPASLRVWKDYELDHYTREIFADPLVGDDGDLTQTRDYSSYVRKMDEIAELKFLDTAPYLRPGRIGDIGCAVGSWIKLACEHPALNESDFYGVEVARPLLDVCIQRKVNGEFANPSIFFKRKNAVTGRCFRENSMDTIHTGSITHEIESYGSRSELITFIRERFAELKPGGVWINRDVIGPDDGDREVLMWLDEQDGADRSEPDRTSRAALANWLNRLSTYSRFLQFTNDFRQNEDDPIQYQTVDVGGRRMIRLQLRDAAEFLLTKDYTDNWESEMHERFCFWSFQDWVDNLCEAGFRVDPHSKSYRNPWIVENRWDGRAELYDPDTMTLLEFPPTNVLLVAEKL